MQKNKSKTSSDADETDDDIRALVVARLKQLSPDTMKLIGDKGVFDREELIEHVERGDEIGEVIKNIEMEWLRAMTGGIVEKLYE
jgi:hypothetical protein